MHQNSSFRILSECLHGYIGMCECCREFNFAYKTVLLTFQEDSMAIFFEWIMASRFLPEHYMPLRHGSRRIFSSPHGNLFLVYRDEEIDQILQLYSQVRLILEAEKVLLSNRMN